MNQNSRRNCTVVASGFPAEVAGLCSGRQNTPLYPAKRHYLEFQRLVEEFYIKWHFPSDYADRMGLTEKHLNEVIKIQSSKSAGLIIRERILLEAKRLLFNSDWNAKEISYHLQFLTRPILTVSQTDDSDTPQFFRQESRKKFQHM